MKKTIIAFTFLFGVLASSAQTWSTKAPNSSNPYDSIGLLHNQGLTDTKNQIGVSAKDRTLGFSTNMYPWLSSETRNEIVDLGIYKALNDSTNYSPDYMSQVGKNFSSQILSTIAQISDSNMVDGGASSVRGLEAQILASDISEDEKKALLIASSVARYSLYYWVENAKKDEREIDEMAIGRTNWDNPVIGFRKYGKEGIEMDKSLNQSVLDYNQIYFDNVYKKGWFGRLLRVVVGDVVGALVGAGVGSLAGPGGTMVGGFLGAMSGSLAAADSQGMLD